MKIIINENENYEIKIPNEIKGEDFLEIIEKLIKLSKFIQISSFDLNQKSSIEPSTKSTNTLKRRYVHQGKFKYTKEKVIDILQYYYFGSKEDRKRVCKVVGYNDIHELGKRFSAFIIRFNIQPSEVGLIKFRTRTSPKVNIPNWVIKSHTGLFDYKSVEEVKEIKEEITQCPNCKKVAKGKEEIEELFGYRFMNGKFSPQSHCKECKKTNYNEEYF